MAIKTECNKARSSVLNQAKKMLALKTFALFGTLRFRSSAGSLSFCICAVSSRHLEHTSVEECPNTKFYFKLNILHKGSAADSFFLDKIQLDVELVQ